MSDLQALSHWRSHHAISASQCSKIWEYQSGISAGCMSVVFAEWREFAQDASSIAIGLGTAHWAVRCTVSAFMGWRVLSAQQLVARGFWAQNACESAFGAWNSRVGSLRLFDRAAGMSSLEVTQAYGGWLSTMRCGREGGLLVMWAAIWWSITQMRVNLVNTLL